MALNPWLMLLVGILIGWLLGWLADVLFLRYDRLAATRKLAETEADLKQSNTELDAARLTIAGLQTKAAPQPAETVAEGEAPVAEAVEAPEPAAAEVPAEVAMEAQAADAASPAAEAGETVAAGAVVAEEAGREETEIAAEGVPAAAEAPEAEAAPVREVEAAPAAAAAAHVARDGHEQEELVRAGAAGAEEARIAIEAQPESPVEPELPVETEAPVAEQPVAELEIPELAPQETPQPEAEVPAVTAEAGVAATGAAALVAAERADEATAEVSVPEMEGMAPEEAVIAEEPESAGRSYTWHAAETPEIQVSAPPAEMVETVIVSSEASKLEAGSAAAMEPAGRFPSAEIEEPTYEMASPPVVVPVPEGGLPFGAGAAPEGTLLGVSPAAAGKAVAAAVGVAALAGAAGRTGGEDDLTRLEGIGPVYAATLRENGISTFATLAETNEARLAEIIAASAWRRVNYGEWVSQARLAAGGDEAGLKDLQDKLFSRERDNLMLIKGVGTKTAGALHASGIVTFAALADTAADRLAEINRGAGLRGGDYEGWITEARLRSTGKRVPRVRKIRGTAKEMTCPQDLERVRGVGEAYEQKLYGAGIGTYWDLAQAEDDELVRILEIRDFQKVNLGAIKSEALRLAEETGTTERSWGGSLPDDFEALEGIGEIYERRLYEAGVCTYKALANSTVDELAAICKAPAWRMPDYAGWIVQAQALIGKE